MLFILIVLLFVLALIIGQWVYSVCWDRIKHLPPGPLHLPLIGNALQFVSQEATDVLEKMKNKYGDIVTIHISDTNRAVFFLSYDSIVKAFGSKETSDFVADRPIAMSEGRGVKRGILWAGWPAAREPRKFTLRCLKEFGLFGSGSSKTGDHIEEEIASLVSFVDKHTDEPINLRERLQECLASCVMLPLHGQRLDFTNKRSADLYAGGRLLFDSSFLQVTFSSVLPILRFIYPDDSAR